MLDEICRKMFLYMGHCVRVSAQRKAIDERYEDVRNRPIPDTAIIVIDFKMKFEPMKHREKTVEHFGKRGISWHGALIRYFVDAPINAVGPSSGTYRREETMYVDNICGSDNSQDAMGVVSLLEAILTSVKRSLPQIKKAIIQSDNAKTYSNAHIPYFIPYLSHSTGVFIESFIHTETADGKGPIDGHFAICMKLVHAYCDTGFNVATPSQLTIALHYMGGSYNTITDLIHHDRDRLGEIAKIHASGLRDMKKRVDRMNEFRFSPTEKTVECWKYSGVGRPLVYRFKQHVDYGNVGIAEDIGDGSEDLPDDDTDDDADIDDDATDDDAPNIVFDGSESELDTSSGGEDAATSTLRIGRVTGFKIVEPALLNRRQRKWKIRADRQREDEAARAADDGDDGDGDDSSGVAFVCGDCARSFASQSFMDRHHCLPKQSSSLLAVAQEIAVDLVNRHEVNIDVLENSDVTDIRSGLSEESLRANFVVPHDFKAGWAQRPKQGAMYGEKYLDEFSDEIKEMFMRGVKDKSRKMTAEMMLAELEKSHPGTYALPGIPAIKSKISSIMKSVSNGSDASGAAAGSSSNRRGRKASYDQKYAEALSRYLDENGLASKPMGALRWLKEEYAADVDADTFPTDAQAKSLFSRLKSARKVRQDEL